QSASANNPAWWSKRPAPRALLELRTSPAGTPLPCPCARPAPHTVHGEHSFPHLLVTRCRREARGIEFYQPCSGTCRSVATIKGAPQASGQTTRRAASTRENNRPRCRQRAPIRLAPFHRLGCAQRINNYSAVGAGGRAEQRFGDMTVR